VAERIVAARRPVLALYGELRNRLPEMTRSQYAIRALEGVR